MKERLLIIHHSRESIVGYDGIVGRSDLDGREEIGNHSGTVMAVGVNSVGVYCKRVFLKRFEVYQLHLGPLQ